MEHPGKLKLNLTDVHGAPIKEDVEVILRHQTRGTEARARIPAGTSALIEHLLAQPDGVYSIVIDSRSYLPVGRVVAIQPEGTTTLDVTLPVDPFKVKSLQAPAFAALRDDVRRLLEATDALLLFEGKRGVALYDALDDLRRAGLLNIAAKAHATSFASGRSVLSYVTRLMQVRGDRIYATVSHELPEETRKAVAAGLFHEADGSLHEPPPGFQSWGSFKTNDQYGNLQLTFFAGAGEWCADIDIDDAAGLAHAFQVTRNALRNRATNPYDIHQILIHHQRVDPGYVLLV
jgi:hypothetical protein